jgi:hypothetical protein
MILTRRGSTTRLPNIRSPVSGALATLSIGRIGHDRSKFIPRRPRLTFKEAIVLPVNICVPVEFELTLETIGLFYNLPAWNEATVGSLEERKARRRLAPGPKGGWLPLHHRERTDNIRGWRLH